MTHSTIGFWTDNGGYYHYALGNKSMGTTYEEVLPKVKAYHDAIGTPGSGTHKQWRRWVAFLGSACLSFICTYATDAPWGCIARADKQTQSNQPPLMTRCTSRS